MGGHAQVHFCFATCMTDDVTIASRCGDTVYTHLGASPVSFKKKSQQKKGREEENVLKTHLAGSPIM